MANLIKRRTSAVVVSVTSGLVAAALLGGGAAQAAPSPNRPHFAPGRTANEERESQALKNGSGRVTKIKPVEGPWSDKKLSPDQRADRLIAKMTLAEKVSRLHGDFSAETAFYIAPLPRLGIPALLMTDAGGGVRVTNPSTNGGRATALPAPIALGATWDPRLATQYGDVLGTEVRATGQNGLLGPTGDLIRDPRWGRQFEALSEDPRLASALIAPQVEAIQKHDVVATVKHPGGYGQETGRLNGANVNVSDRALHEVYLAPIDAAVKAGVGSAMCSFNKVNGVYACENSEIFNIMKQEGGFKGFIQTDYAAQHSTVAAAEAGLDVEFPASNYYGQPLIDAVNNGSVTMASVDEKVHRVLRTMFAMGIFDNPVQVTPLPEAADSAAAQKIAEQSAVLLKNSPTIRSGSSPVLPLDGRTVKSIAVIGADADATAQGGGSSVVKPTRTVTPLEGITARAGSGVKVEYAEGTDPVGPAHELMGAAVPSSVLTPSGDSNASGLSGQYWRGNNTSGPADLTRTDKQVALSAGFLTTDGLYGSSVPTLPGFSFSGPLSARWTGSFTAPATGAYTLSLSGIGSAHLFLDGSEIVDSSGSHGVRTDTSATLQLVKGERHDVRIEYVNDGSDSDQENAADLVLGWTHPDNAIAPAVAEAAATAERSDVAVVLARDYVGEARDKRTLTLANEQDALISAVAKANPRTIVVLTTSGSVNMPWIGSVPSVIEGWYGGQEQGTAIARVLFGDVNPSAKLPVTFATSDAATPTSDAISFPGVDHTATVDENIGYRGYLAKNITPQFSFGTGLSYTSFNYSHVKTVVSGKPVRNGGSANVDLTVDVRNTGGRNGTETVQVYAGTLPTDTVSTPIRQLAGFAKIDLAKGASSKVTVHLDPKAFSYWDATAKSWVTPTGPVKLFVGSSSSDIRQTATAVVR